MSTQLSIILIAVSLVYGLSQLATLPDVELEEWWGPRGQDQDTSIRPFKITFNETMLADLKLRLSNHRPSPPPLEGVAFQYGFNSRELSTWLRYWAQEYPFAERERFLNQFPQYKTNIQGLDIHFIRVKAENATGKEVIPLLLLHGWPGSVREFYEMIPLLIADRNMDFAVEAIVPSLPGFGFSDAAVRPGLGVDKMAVVFRNLMHRLGYRQYYVQGGDMGAVISSNMATLFPDEVLGYHTNLVFTHTPFVLLLIALGSLNPELVARPELQHRLYPLLPRLAAYMEETGYLHQQATKPDTVGIGLSDSPAGLAAYILEKFSTATRAANRVKPGGGLTEFYTREQLVDNLMIYWTTNCMTTSLRLYAETFNKRYFGLRINEIQSNVPTAVIQASNEILYLPPWIIRLKFPRLLSSALADGGHFLALERPGLFANNVLHSLDAFRTFHRTNGTSWIDYGDYYWE